MIAVSCHAALHRGLSMDEVQRLGREIMKDIIACGFDPEKTFIFSDIDYMSGGCRDSAFTKNILHIKRCGQRRPPPCALPEAPCNGSAAASTLVTWGNGDQHVQSGLFLGLSMRPLMAVLPAASHDMDLLELT